MLSIILMLCAFTNNSIAQDKLPDDGFSSESHRKNVGSIVFSKALIEYQKENPDAYTREFNYGEPIYGRYYWSEGLNNIFLKAGIDTTKGYNLMCEMKANGKEFYSYLFTRTGTNTTCPLCFYPAESDTYPWKEMLIIYYNLTELSVGKNDFTITLYPYDLKAEKPGDALCSGSFSLNVDDASLKRANQYIFTGLKTTWSSGDDSWSEWNIYLDGKSGVLKTKWSRDKSEWVYEVGKTNGNIKTTWSNNFTEWTVSTPDGTIGIKQTWSNDWKEWTIRSADETLTVKTTWSGDDAWKEWDVRGSGGTMKIKTRWSGDDAWREWSVYDNMASTDAHLKMAAVFITMFASSLY